MMIETNIYNPGICDRLEEDVIGFSRYGFRFERRRKDNTTNGEEEQDEKDESTAQPCCYGVLYSPPTPIPMIPNPSSSSFSQYTTHIKIHLEPSNVALLSSIGPLLRTLVRLCIHPINPHQSLHVIVVCCHTASKIDARGIAHGIHMLIRNSMGAALFMNLIIVLPSTCRIEDVRRYMNQNDDGCYQYPTVQLLVQHDDSNYLINYLATTLKKTPLHVDLGLTITGGGSSSSSPPIVQKPIPTNLLWHKNFDPQKQYLSLKVTTRMCTLRYMPLLYQLANKLLSLHPAQLQCSSTHNATINNNSNNDNMKQPSPTVQTEQQQQQQLWIVCLEKVSNLYRVLMLVRDYCYSRSCCCSTCDRGEGDGHDDGSILLRTILSKQLMIVVKTKQQAKEFQNAGQAFVTKNFIMNNTKPPTKIVLQVKTIQEAKEHLLLSTLVSSSTSSSSTVKNNNNNNNKPTMVVVAFDLHPMAKTLGQRQQQQQQQKRHCSSENSTIDNNDKHKDDDDHDDHDDDDDPTIHLLKKSNAIILGFESNGIPKEFLYHNSQSQQHQQQQQQHEKDNNNNNNNNNRPPPVVNNIVTDYLQIQSRTSINVIAAFSILLHVLQ